MMGFFVACSPIQANESLSGQLTERMLLVQISEELALLEQLSRDGRATIDVTKNVVARSHYFDYRTLEGDLADMRQSILEYLARPSRLPRVLNHYAR